MSKYAHTPSTDDPPPLTSRTSLTSLKNLMGSWMGALAGAGFYGGIVAALNWQAGPQTAIRSALGHAAVSAALTLFGTSWMRKVFNANVTSEHRLALTFLAGMALTYALLIGMHLALQTPRMLLSLAPGLLPNIVFCATYSGLLARTARPCTHVESAGMSPSTNALGCMS